MSRAEQLVSAVVRELRHGKPPLSHDFVELWEVTPEEYEFLCEFLAGGAEKLGIELFPGVAVPA